ncbi:MAG: hypothetical protein JNL87_12910 [Burkholderiaceae bacterium]|nr:hypothetical protein [Burkholderiaceae bacterium]
MAFKLVVSDTVTVPVKGSLPNAAGVAAPFAFSLQARRLQADALRDLAQDNERTVAEFLASVVFDWSAVLGEDDKPAPFSEAGLAQLLNIVGMAGLAFTAYVEACGARGKEKN